MLYQLSKIKWAEKVRHGLSNPPKHDEADILDTEGKVNTRFGGNPIAYYNHCAEIAGQSHIESATIQKRSITEKDLQLWRSVI